MSNHHNNKKEENTNKVQVTPPPPNNSNDGVIEPLKVTTRYLEVKNYKNIGVQNEQEKDDV